MKRLADIRGEDALEVLADLLDPATEIMADNEVAELARSGQKIKAVSRAIKNHKKAVITILALLDQEDPSEYKPPLTALPLKLIELFNDPDLVQVFTLQGQKIEETSSGSATVSMPETDAE